MRRYVFCRYCGREFSYAIPRRGKPGFCSKKCRDKKHAKDSLESWNRKVIRRSIDADNG